MIKNQSILTEAALEAAELFKQVREELRKFSPEPFMKRRITKRQAEKLMQKGGDEWQFPGM